METKINLNKLETKIFITSYKDGLLDMFLGVILLQFVIGPFLTDIGFSDFAAAAAFIPIWIIAFIAYFLIKKYIIKPRTGNIKPGPVRRAKMIKANIFGLLILFVGFLFGLLYADFSSTINFLFPITFSLLILLISFISAHYFSINRLYYYGLMVAFAPIIGEILWKNGWATHHGFPIVFGLSSFVLITVGLTLFIRFLHTNPLIKVEK